MAYLVAMADSGIVHAELDKEGQRDRTVCRLSCTGWRRYMGNMITCKRCLARIEKGDKAKETTFAFQGGR